MPQNIFGTDGVRGVANADLSCDLAFRLGRAATKFLGPDICVGRDTRLSGTMLESALTAGIMAEGGRPHCCGVIPTPAVALLTVQNELDGGIVISASHNPPEYNGIKIFNGQGFKLPDSVEDEIEAFMARGGAAADELPNGDEVGVAVPVEDACELYIQHAVQSVEKQGIDFKGLKVALDTGHGASCMTSAEALRRLGADVTVINDDYCGTDINVQCGSTHLEPLRALVAECGADVGIAHDGDADRVMLMDSEGNEIDGDMVEAVCAIDLKQRGLLAGDTAVSTVMANLGLTHALRDAGINLIQTKVGDRYVLEAMREGGYVIGGEQSGHTIFLEHNSTGDGLVTALQFLAACKRAGKSAAEAAKTMTRFPQTLINVRVKDKHAADGNQAIADAVAAAEAALGEDGRVLLRPSGTEPVVRVMVEAMDQQAAEQHAKAIAEVVEREI